MSARRWIVVALAVAFGIGSCVSEMSFRDGCKAAGGVPVIDRSSGERFCLDAAAEKKGTP